MTPPTIKLLAINLPFQMGRPKVYLQVPTIRIVIPELQCCPTDEAQEATSNFCQALCLCKYPLPHPASMPLGSDPPGHAQLQRLFISEQPVSEPRHPLKPSCLFIVLYLQHPWPLVLFLYIIFKSLSAQLLVG